jgi:FixJ family two-component response regulator
MGLCLHETTSNCSRLLLFMAGQQRVIAIIDDDPGIRKSLETLLAVHRYGVEAYSSAEEFINSAIVTEASCLIVDIQLGDISGIELGRHLSGSGFAFPIIFITGSEDEMLRRQAMDFGCVAYLRKPFPMARLIEAIDEAIGANSQQG